jgi:hypothetical protein
MNDHERHVSILVGSRALEHAADALTVSPSRATTKGAVRGSDGLCKLGAKGAIAQLRENLRELGRRDRGSAELSLQGSGRRICSEPFIKWPGGDANLRWDNPTHP